MSKMEQVIKWLNECLEDDCVSVFVPRDVVEDAVALLKAQEPIAPNIIDTALSKKYHDNIFKNYYCGNCGELLHTVNRKDLFCSQCGRKVKWDAD